jgi:glycosyltransferase involved in cell wall biosynthesis
MAKPLSSLNVAIVHDWLIGGGAERVVLELHHMFPDAPIYTSYSTDVWRARLDDKVITGFLQHRPFPALRKYIPFLRAWWFSHLDLRAYDLVISSSGAEAKGIRTSPDTLHINYCHTPVHYYWVRYDEYLKNPGFGRFDWLARFGLKALIGPMRKWDLRAAARPTVMVANSTQTQTMIKKYYRRDVAIVHPPVDVARFKSQKKGTKRHGFVIAGRQTPYKRTDIAVKACSDLKLPLVVIGNGPDHVRLKKLAGESVTFLTDVSDEAIANHFQAAEAFIFPAMDDFGITPVEAMASGTPVIAYKGGGALDYVVPGKTGEFFEKQTAKSLKSALESFQASSYNVDQLEAKAASFAPAEFIHNMQEIIKKSLLEADK